MTYYNPNKPKGKHHLKFYTICENSHWCALEIKMCHRFKKDEDNMEEASEYNVQGKENLMITYILIIHQMNLISMKAMWRKMTIMTAPLMNIL